MVLQYIAQAFSNNAIMTDGPNHIVFLNLDCDFCDHRRKKDPAIK